MNKQTQYRMSIEWWKVTENGKHEKPFPKIELGVIASSTNQALRIFSEQLSSLNLDENGRRRKRQMP